MQGRARAGLVGVLLLAAGCAEPTADGPPVAQRSASLDAICVVNVEGTGPVDVEEDYVAHVVQCENGAADYEALKAQAVAARSYMYYRMQTGDGTIRDSQADQVYSCNRGGPREIHFRAARETAGQVLGYADVTVAAFYVAGAIPQAPDCVATPQDDDPTNTERFVTYNQGRSGDDLIQTPLGWVNPANVRNRGCKSQNGANCLSRAGWDYRDIIHFYYGADIEIVQAVGPCVDPVEPPDAGPPADAGVDLDAGPEDAGVVDAAAADAAPDAGPVVCPAAAADGVPAIVDDSSRCFTFGCETGEWGVGQPRGYEGGMLTAPTIDAEGDDCVGVWQAEVAAAGEYDVEVHIEPGDRRLTASARYLVESADGITAVPVNQNTVDGWLWLGRFRFEPSAPVRISLGDATGEPFAPEGPRVVYDALRITAHVEADPPPRPDAAPPVDAAVPPVDRGPTGDGGGLPLNPIADDEAEGCATAPGRGPSPWWSALAVVIVAAIRRRTRASARLAG